MSGADSDLQVIRRAIRHAQAAAPERTEDGDRRFVMSLRDFYFTEQRQATRRLPVISPRGLSRLVRDRIFDDPRYLQNARMLAEKSNGKLRVIGGSVVRGRNFEDCVAVGDDSSWACTGTVIAPRLVLSAGHCLEAATRVFVGNDVSRKGRVICVQKQIRHPHYHKNGRRNDLLLLVLAETLDLAPRRLAPGEMIDRAKDGRVVGFGNTDPNGAFGYGIKRQTDVPVASPGCAGSLDEEEDRIAYGCDVGLEIVAGKPLLARDSCNGDSGGPFYLDDDQGRWFLAGVTSRATTSATNACGDGGIYVRLDKYRRWIESSMKILSKG